VDAETRFVVIGAGKTGVDAVLSFLFVVGFDPD